MARRSLIAAAALSLWAAAGLGQEGQERPPFLLLNQEQLLTGSGRGQALLAEEEAAREALRATAREIERAFEAEEQRLTGQRGAMDAAAFRDLADDFDARVIEARADQDARAAALAQEFDQRRRQFYADVGPILVALMEEVGALAILDEGAVLLADQGLNITTAVIAEIDRQPSDGTPAAEPAPDAPDAGVEQEGGPP